MALEALIIIMTGLNAGFLSGLLGIGGGTITIPALILLMGATPHLAQGTSLALIVPTALMGSYAYYRRGYVNLEVGKWMLVGAFFGVLIGAQLAAYVPALLLQRIFGLFLVFLSVRMLLGR